VTISGKSSSSSSNLTGGGSRRSLLAKRSSTSSRRTSNSGSSKGGSASLIHGRWDSCNMFVCVSLDAPAFNDDHHNYDDFPMHLQRGLICFISPNTSPPPHPPPPSATSCSYRIAGFSCATPTPHIALLTSHVACVTHVPAGITFLAFVSFWILFGLLYAYCELTNPGKRFRRKQKKSQKIIEPTSAPLNIEMTTASGGEAALPRDKGEEVQIV
jgi:hypothetical protein